MTELLIEQILDPEIDFVVGVGRWSVRVWAYAGAMALSGPPAS